MKTEKVVGWIPVKERLPEIRENVFIYNERAREHGEAGIGIFIAYLGDDEEGYYWVIDGTFTILGFEDVKFWAPLLDKPPFISEE